MGHGCFWRGTDAHDRHFIYGKRRPGKARCCIFLAVAAGNLETFDGHAASSNERVEFHGPAEINGGENLARTEVEGVRVPRSGGCYEMLFNSFEPWLPLRDNLGKSMKRNGIVLARFKLYRVATFVNHT